MHVLAVEFFHLSPGVAMLGNTKAGRRHAPAAHMERWEGLTIPCPRRVHSQGHAETSFVVFSFPGICLCRSSGMRFYLICDGDSFRHYWKLWNLTNDVSQVNESPT